MEESYEYANELGKQGRKNPRYIPKITINRELFSCAIEKIKNIYTHAQSLGIKERRAYRDGIKRTGDKIGMVSVVSS